jgi:hypothetical protein
MLLLLLHIAALVLLSVVATVAVAAADAAC